MTLDEAIKIYEMGAKRTWNGRLTIYAEQCQQMAEWLKDYKQLLEQYNGDIGEISDGYHTFNQLYHQRAILFATIVNQNTDRAWKSYKHSDGKYCFDSNGEWFIVGVDTPEGSYTYHYSKEYWNYFKCKELDCGKEWDGHTEEDVTRLLSLQAHREAWGKAKRTVKAYLMLEGFGSEYQDDIENLIDGCIPKEGE